MLKQLQRQTGLASEVSLSQLDLGNRRGSRNFRIVCRLRLSRLSAIALRRALLFNGIDHRAVLHCGPAPRCPHHPKPRRPSQSGQRSPYPNRNLLTPPMLAVPEKSNGFSGVGESAAMLDQRQLCALISVISPIVRGSRKRSLPLNSGDVRSRSCPSGR